MKGFTLIEILIAVAIVGILMAIALPSYRDSQLRSARAEAKTALLEVASMQERFYSLNNSYSTNANPLVSPAEATYTSTNGEYVVTVAACGGGSITNCFIATATPQGGQADDSCGNLTLTSTGVRAASGGTQDECWVK